MNVPAGFPLFLVVWNRMQGQTTPGVHLKIAMWLAARWRAGDTRLLLMAFRSCGKSTIVGLFAAWLLWRQPDLRILVMAADSMLAVRMVRNTRRIIERHALTGHLRPERADQWASDRFTVRRKAEWRDPSMAAYGIDANVTGARADVIICDDVEVPNTSDTREKREALRERLSELSFVLVPGGMQLFVGTPHAFETIYATQQSQAPDAGPPFLDGYDDLRVPILDDLGNSAWPDRFDAAAIAALQKAGGPRRFAAQMMLKAQPITDARLHVEALQWYDEPLDRSEAQGKPVFSIDGRRMKAVRAWWDPAFGRGGDGSVVAVVMMCDAGEYWLHHLAYLRVDDRDSADEATQQCRAVANLCSLYGLSVLHVEINGIGRFLPGILRRELGGKTTVIEVTSRRSKDLRITEGFDAVLAARALHVHRTVARTPFIEEMRSWKPGGNNRDDGLDAVAGAIALHGVRVGVGPFMPRAVKTDFNVME